MSDELWPDSIWRDAFARVLVSQLAPLPADAPAEMRALFAQLRAASTRYLRSKLSPGERAALADNLRAFANDLIRAFFIVGDGLDDPPEGQR